MKPSIKMPSPAMVVALVALFVSLGGSAYVVSKVGTNQIKNNAVTVAKLKSGAVRGNRLSVVQVEGETVSMEPGTSAIAQATCPPGRKAICYTWDSALSVSYYYTLLTGSSALLYALAPSDGEGTYEATATVTCV